MARSYSILSGLTIIDCKNKDGISNSVEPDIVEASSG